MRICIVTTTSPCRKGLADITTPNMIHYANKHNYGTYINDVEDGKWEYKKHEALKQLFEYGFDAVWLKDDDILISQLSVPIETFIDDKHDVYITKDFTELNGGSIIWKNTKGGNLINNMILHQRRDFDNEQNAMNFWFPSFVNVKVLPQSTINSYRYDLYPECSSYVGREDLGDFVEGKSFVLHVPALSLGERIEVLKNIPVIE